MIDMLDHFFKNNSISVEANLHYSELELALIRRRAREDKLQKQPDKHCQ
ncbi:MAG: hypothetical protein AAF933_01140 [Pseudomonadota bacterium]